MRAAATIFGLALSLAAGAALACPRHHLDEGDRYGPETSYGGDDGYEADEAYDEGRYDGDATPAVWREDDGGLYMHGHRAGACGCDGAEVSLSSSFFDGGGGVGPIPDSGTYGGGYYVIYGGGGGGARASSFASASASARSSASVSVRYRGGYGHGSSHGGKHR